MPKVKTEGAEYTLRKADSPDKGGKVTGKANIFGVLDRGIRQSDAKAANKGGGAFDKMKSGMDKLGGSDRDKYAK